MFSILLLMDMTARKSGLWEKSAEGGDGEKLSNQRKSEEYINVLEGGVDRILG